MTDRHHILKERDSFQSYLLIDRAGQDSVDTVDCFETLFHAEPRYAKHGRGVHAEPQRMRGEHPFRFVGKQHVYSSGP